MNGSLQKASNMTDTPLRELEVKWIHRLRNEEDEDGKEWEASIIKELQIK